MITEDEYWRAYDLIRGDVEAAIKSNHAYLTTHALAAAEDDILRKYNRHPDFWMLNAFALQTTFFIALGRIFDTRSDSHSVQKLVDATIANPHIFSKSALRQRKLKTLFAPGCAPDWLGPYIDNAWEPVSRDLEPIKLALQPHVDRYRETYAPIRHKFFGHRAMGADKTVSEWWGKALISDVDEMLRFLHTLLWAIHEMAWNARTPDLTDFSNYERYKAGANEKIEAFIRHLP